MADSMTEQSGVPGVPGSAGQDPAALFRAWLQSQSGQGMTQMGPNLQGGPRQRPMADASSPQQGARDFSSRGAAQKQSMQNLTSSIKGVMGQITNKISERKNREQQQVFDKFTQAVTGLNQAQDMAAQAKKANDEALKQFQNAKTPEEKQQASQAMKQAAEQMKKAQSAVQQNQQILNDEYNPADPKGQKRMKILEKGFGIDDKNADTPERKQAIQSIQKAKGLGQGPASILASRPQTMQPSTEAQQQKMAHETGAAGKPATGGQILAAEGKKVDQVLKQEKIATDAGLKTDEILTQLPKRGLTVDKDDKGSPQRNPDGTLKIRNMTEQEMLQNPAIYEQYQMEKAKVNAATANAESNQVRAKAAMIRAQKVQADAAKAKDPSAIQAWVSQVTDPASGVTIANVPSTARSAVVQAVAQSGQKISKPLTGDEIKRADLANNAVENLKAAQDILKKRPDMFGPAGWGKTKFEYALAGGDPDALDFKARIKLANLPLVGIHGVRGKWAVEDFDKLDGNLYLNPDSMGNVLNDAVSSASGFAKMGGRKELRPAERPKASDLDKILDEVFPK